MLVNSSRLEWILNLNINLNIFQGVCTWLGLCTTLRQRSSQNQNLKSENFYQVMSFFSQQQVSCSRSFFLAWYSKALYLWTIIHTYSYRYSKLKKTYFVVYRCPALTFIVHVYLYYYQGCILFHRCWKSPHPRFEKLPKS